MEKKRRLLPMSVQSFEKLRENECLYVDKTEYVYRLVHDVAQFFFEQTKKIWEKSASIDASRVLGRQKGPIQRTGN